MAVELLVIRNSGSGQNPATGGRGVLPLAGRWNPEYCGPLDGSSWGAKEEQVMLFYKHFSHLFFKIRADATYFNATWRLRSSIFLFSAQLLPYGGVLHYRDDQGTRSDLKPPNRAIEIF
jgi:hypothetical protein